MSAFNRILAIILAILLVAGGYVLSSFINPISEVPEEEYVDQPEVLLPDFEPGTETEEPTVSEPGTEPEETEVPEPGTEPEETEAPEPGTEPEETEAPEPGTEPEETEAPEPGTEPEETEAPEPGTEPEETAEPEPTEEPEPEPTEEPDAEPLTADFFDDAAFLGDSISGTLEYYGSNGTGLGKATFLVRTDYSVRAAVDGSMTVMYKGRAMRPENALAECGAKKVYIMLGAMGDIGSQGIDKTMEYWATLLENIRGKCPDIRIFIQSCTPLAGDTPRLTNKMVDEYNERLSEFAAENDCTFVEIGAHFKGDNGYLPYKYCRDGFAHLRIDAGKYWAELLKDPANYSISPREA